MAFKVLNLLAVTAVALFAASANVTPVTALSFSHLGEKGNHLNRQVHHDQLAKRSKRSSTARCKTRPSSSISIAQANKATSSAAESTSTSEAPAPTTTTQAAPKTTSTKAAATTSSAAAVAVTTTTSSSSSGNGKVGIAWNGGNAASLGNLVTGNTHYIYTWSPYSPDNLFGLEFVPMLWGSDQITPFNQLVVAGYGKNLLFINEPNQSGQAEMSPSDAATLWQQQFSWRTSEGYSLWSPAVTNAADGETWMDSFLDACSGCSLSAMALHIYGTDPQALITYVQHWHTKYGLPIVITEFACQNFGGGAQATMDEVWAFYQTVIPWLMSQDYVIAFFPFGFLEDMGNVNPDNQLMKNGQLTDLGSYVVNGPY